MKTRFGFSAFCMLVAMTMATSAFAQATFTVSSGNQPRGRMNGYSEKAGGVTLAKLSGANVGDEGGSVIIDYGVPITNDVGGADMANSISVSICDGREADNSTAVDVSDNTITVTVGTGACTGTDAAIDVSGVLLALVGSGQESIMATVSSTGGVRLPSGSNQVSVINAIVDELTDDGVDVANTLVLTRHTGDEDPEDDTLFHLVLEENTVDSFAGAELNLEFSGIPDGVSLTLDAWVATKKKFDDKKVDQEVELRETDAAAMITHDPSNDQVSIGKPGDMEDTVTATNDETTVFIGSPMFTVVPDPDAPTETVVVMGGTLSATAVDVVIVQGSIDLGDDDNVAALLPLDLDIQVTAEVGPIGDEDDVADDGPPVFASDITTAVTVVESTSAQTTMNVAYVLSNTTFDTGIAVSNMTKDQAGAVHFTFYMNGQETTYSTPSMMGPRSTMSILLSELLASAEHTGSFSGQMIITADFTEADAGVFISDFVGFTSAATVRMEGMEN